MNKNATQKRAEIINIPTDFERLLKNDVLK
jgi:hypothetical protein